MEKETRGVEKKQRRAPEQTTQMGGGRSDAEKGGGGVATRRRKADDTGRGEEAAIGVGGAGEGMETNIEKKKRGP